jgi:hypothetical protein
MSDELWNSLAEPWAVIYKVLTNLISLRLFRILLIGVAA